MNSWNVVDYRCSELSVTDKFYRSMDTYFKFGKFMELGMTSNHSSNHNLVESKNKVSYHHVPAEWIISKENNCGILASCVYHLIDWSNLQTQGRASPTRWEWCNHSKFIQQVFLDFWQSQGLEIGLDLVQLLTKGCWSASFFIFSFSLYLMHH